MFDPSNTRFDPAYNRPELGCVYHNTRGGHEAVAKAASIRIRIGIIERFGDYTLEHDESECTEVYIEYSFSSMNDSVKFL